jgi:hypothetical protein
MQAAQDAAEVPLLVGEVADRVVDGVDAGIENGVQIETAADDDPQQIEPIAPRWRRGLSWPPNGESKASSTRRKTLFVPLRNAAWKLTCRRPLKRG